MDTSVMGLFVLLSLLNKIFWDYIVAGLRLKWADSSFWWVNFATLVTGLLLSLGFGVNLFTAFAASTGGAASPLMGKILTGILIGGGAVFTNVIINWFQGTPAFGRSAVQGDIAPGKGRRDRPVGW